MQCPVDKKQKNNINQIKLNCRVNNDQGLASMLSGQLPTMKKCDASKRNEWGYHKPRHLGNDKYLLYEVFEKLFTLHLYWKLVKIINMRYKTAFLLISHIWLLKVAFYSQKIPGRLRFTRTFRPFPRTRMRTGMRKPKIKYVPIVFELSARLTRNQEKDKILIKPW